MTVVNDFEIYVTWLNSKPVSIPSLKFRSNISSELRTLLGKKVIRLYKILVFQLLQLLH